MIKSGRSYVRCARQCGDYVVEGQGRSWRGESLQLHFGISVGSLGLTSGNYLPCATYSRKLKELRSRVKIFMSDRCDSTSTESSSGTSMWETSFTRE